MSKKPKKSQKNTLTLSIKVNEGLMERIEAHLSRLEREVHGVNWTRSSTAVNLIVRGLDLAEADQRHWDATVAKRKAK